MDDENPWTPPPSWGSGGDSCRRGGDEQLPVVDIFFSKKPRERKKSSISTKISSAGCTTMGIHVVQSQISVEAITSFGV